MEKEIYKIFAIEKDEQREYALKKYFKDFLEFKFKRFDMDVFNIDMMDFAEYDVRLPDAFLNPTFYFEIRTKLNKVMEEIRKDFDFKKDFSFNFLPDKEMDFKYIDNLNLNNQNRIFRFQGYVEAISSIYGSILTMFKCPACKKFNKENRVIKKCQYCFQKITDDQKSEYKKTYRDFDLKESYDYRQIAESVSCRVELSQNPKANIFDIQSMLSKRLDFLAQVKINEISKGKYVIFLEIIGIKDAKTRELDDEKKKEIDDYITENEDKIIDILADNIFYGHKGDYWIKIAMICCAIGLNPEDSNFDDTKSKQMILQWIGHVGSGKSNLINRLLKFFENSSKVGQANSKVGIGGGSDKNASGQFVFRMGELSRCHNGIFCGDEIGMWDKEILNTISEQMSEGTITYTKIIKSKQKVFINYILCGNPPEGEFNPYKTYFENIGATPQINDRSSIQIITPNPPINEEKMKSIFSATIGYNDEKKIKELHDDVIKDMIKRIKEDYPNPHITREMVDYAQKHFMKVATLTPENKDGFQREKKGLKTFHTRAWENFCRFIKSVGRIRKHKEATKDDVEFAWQLLWEGSYVNLLRDYGDIGLETWNIKEKHMIEEIKDESDRPRNYNQLVKWVFKKLNQSSTRSIECMELEKSLKMWGLSHYMDKLLDQLNNERVAYVPTGTDKLVLL